MKNIHNNIKSLRNKLGYSQEYVAKQLNMTQSGYGYIEDGKRELKYRMLYDIAEVLNINIIDLITYPDKYEKINSDNINVANEPISMYGNSDPKISLSIEIPENKKQEIFKILNLNV